MNQETGDLELEAFGLAGGGGTGRGLAVRRACQTLRYYRWPQIARRVAGVLGRRLPGRRTVGSIEVPSGLDLVQDKARARRVAGAVVSDYRQHASHSRGNPETGTLVLLNQEAHPGFPLDWKRPNPALPRLWRFHLHYHEYLLSFVADRELAERPTDPAWDTVWQVIASWIDAHAPENEPAAGDAWHPYCISRRLPVWIWLLALGQPPPAIRRRMVGSTYQQASYLAQNLELDVGGNHLLENLAALLVAGCCVGGGEFWVDAATPRLKRELAVQVLPHGEHFERAPMYHCQVLGHLLEISYLAADRWPDLAKVCSDVSRPMLDFLAAIRLPDGSIPLLGDSVQGEAPSPERIGRLAALAGMHLAEPRAGVTERGPYWVWRSGARDAEDLLLLDRGEVGAADLPAHAHCDLLNVVAWVGGRPWFIDSGNFDYESGSMRQYCRSSLAHNVATVNGRNSCDIWSRFRMGWRGRVTGMASGSRQTLDWAAAGHDGYRRQGVPQVHRVVLVERETGAWICADLAGSRSSSGMRGYLHIAPEVQISPATEGDGSPVFRLDDGRTRRRLLFFGTASVRIREGWHCPAFGVRQRHPVLVYDQGSGPNSGFGWLLHQPDAGRPEVAIDSGGVGVRTGSDTFRWSIPDR